MPTWAKFWQSGVALTTVGIYGALGGRCPGRRRKGEPYWIQSCLGRWHGSWPSFTLPPLAVSAWCTIKGRLATSWAQLWLCLGFLSFSSCRSLKPLMEYPPALPHLPRSLVHTYGHAVRRNSCPVLATGAGLVWHAAITRTLLVLLDAFFGWESCPVAPHPS